MSELGSLQFSPKCPKCGGDLGVEVRDGEPGGDDKVVCQSCGFVAGTRNEVSKKFIAENRSEIEKAAADKIREALRKALRK
ncbi:hypothetical protein HK16_05840 [Acetobacter senegalensis]|uniref:TFIIB-type domain-containing protein n=2 Tax=Acetobacter TaxID=434 RepID=A0A252EKV6_9PROT|nr:hypothetical protein CIW82_13395 [Acetobacter tropicalis]OUL67070.1 hypothetical protein HK16_05840 [Acetobacter senegalensis]